MRNSRWAAAIVLVFAALTIVNAFNYTARLRELNSVPLRTNPLGGDAYQIGSQAAQDRRFDFWIIEGAAFLLCGVAWVLATKRRPA